MDHHRAHFPHIPRIKRRSIQGVPYPQHITLPSPSSPLSASARSYTHPSPIASTMSPPPTTPKPTSSLARRRRNSAVVSPGSIGGGAVTPASSTGNSGYPWDGFAWGGSPDVDDAAVMGMNLCMLGMEMDDSPPKIDSPEQMPSPLDAKASESAFPLAQEIKTEGGDLSKISQAMTLLSLYPPDMASTSQTPLSLSPGTSPEPNWPKAETLLKESLRQSLSAFKGLRRIKALAHKFEGGRQSQSTNPEEMEEIEDTQEIKGRESQQDNEGEVGVVGIEEIYDRALAEMKASREAMELAELRLAEEKEAMRERLLKG